MVATLSSLIFFFWKAFYSLVGVAKDNSRSSPKLTRNSIFSGYSTTLCNELDPVCESMGDVAMTRRGPRTWWVREERGRKE
jgi:hypothetical protein